MANDGVLFVNNTTQSASAKNKKFATKLEREKNMLMMNLRKSYCYRNKEQQRKIKHKRLKVSDKNIKQLNGNLDGSTTVVSLIHTEIST